MMPLRQALHGNCDEYGWDRSLASRETYEFSVLLNAIYSYHHHHIIVRVNARGARARFHTHFHIAFVIIAPMPMALAVCKSRKTTDALSNSKRTNLYGWWIGDCDATLTDCLYRAFTAAFHGDLFSSLLNVRMVWMAKRYFFTKNLTLATMTNFGWCL